MVDIFISYSRHDRSMAKRLAEALEARGWTVWWDTRLRAGQIWDDTIEREIKAARATVVLWSESSIRSRWVRNEARVANKVSTLVPVLLQDVEPPVEYSHVHAASLIGWGSDRADPGLQQFLDDLLVMLGPPCAGAIESPPSCV